ncbi:MAG: glycosyltransferase, partial [Novosphingobium sp.]
PQIAGAADLVLPSKLANMLWSGRPVVATTVGGTGLHAEVSDCGIVTEPGDAHAFAAAIAQLIDNPDQVRRLGEVGRARAAQRWEKEAILTHLSAEIGQLDRRVPA